MAAQQQPEMISREFTHRLPKAELHAHLSGSVSRQCLHTIWKAKQTSSLQDPLTALNPGTEDFVDVVTFFPLFDKYIYALLNDIPSVQLATQQVIQDFADDGVAYLELRTTPRENVETGMSREGYVEAVCEVVEQFCSSGRGGGVEVYLILSIDRKMTLAQAEVVIDLALKHNYRNKNKIAASRVVGIDLCGNPLRGDPSLFRPAFQRGKAHGLGVTVHFAEVPQSGTEHELKTLLSWEPDRLGHVIHVLEQYKAMIQQRGLGLELCLSCNVLAKLTTGGFALHHFREWLETACPIALSTDDVGVFASPLSNEYFLAAQHFGLDKKALVELSLSAARCAFVRDGKFAGRIEAFRDEERL